MKLTKQTVSLLLWCILSFNFIENINASPIFSCLNSIEGPVIYPDDERFPSLIIDQNIRVNYTPSVLVYAIDENDVIKAVNCANLTKNGIIARSGGHSSEKYGLGGRNGTIVLDVTFINGITVYQDTTFHKCRKVRYAKIGAGNRLGDVYNKLNQEGFFIPAGNCPSVGIAGHALGGGYGFYSREYGLAVDNIISMNMVDAGGKFLKNINKYNHSDLYFALRGAGGGSYGIVTHFFFEIHPICPQVTYIYLKFNVTQVQQLFKAFNEAEENPRLDNKITLKIKFDKKDSVLELSIFGLYLGNRTGAETEIHKLLNKTATKSEPKIKPILSEYVEQTFFESVEKLSTLSEPPSPHQSKYEAVCPKHNPNFFKQKSFIVNNKLNSTAIDELGKFLNEASCDTYASIELWGGKINESDPSSSFIHHNALYLILLETDWTYKTSEEQSKKCVDEINEFGSEFQNNFAINFSYQNFMDRDLEDWQKRYYGDVFPKLVKIKRDYDPTNLFNFNQSIPTKVLSQ